MENPDFEVADMTPWRGWSGASISLVPGVTSNAIYAGGRTAWRSGQRQNLEQEDLDCLPPGTFVNIDFKVKLIDETTGQGVDCDPLSTTSCPLVTIRHSTFDYAYNRNKVWNPNGWNDFHGTYLVSGPWTTSVYLMVCGGEPGQAIVVDDITVAVGTSPAPTLSPTPAPLTPTASPTQSPVVTIVEGVPSLIFDTASTVVTTGCTMDKDGTKAKAVDRDTRKFMCFKLAGATEWGVIVSPSHGQLSVAQSLRLYTHSNW